MSVPPWVVGMQWIEPGANYYVQLTPSSYGQLMTRGPQITVDGYLTALNPRASGFNMILRTI